MPIRRDERGRFVTWGDADDRLDLRLSTLEKQTIKERADMLGMTMTDYIRWLVVADKMNSRDCTEAGNPKTGKRAS